jgi:hypothetical protein
MSEFNTVNVPAAETVGEKMFRLEREVERLKADNDDKLKQITAMAKGIVQLRADQKASEIGMDEAYRERKELERRLALAEERLRDSQGEILELRQPRMTRTAEDGLDLPVLPESFQRAARSALLAFAEGYAEYGPGAADEMGLAGQWGDLYRKIKKLRPVMWEGDAERLTRETPDQILQDIIGHCLLALEMIDRGMEGGR